MWWRMGWEAGPSPWVTEKSNQSPKKREEEVHEYQHLATKYKNE